MAHVLVLFLFVRLFVASTESYISNKIALDFKGNYNVSYSFNASSDTLEFLVEARATGWVGFGVAETAPNDMRDYDVAIGGMLRNGTGYLKDYLTMGYPSFDFPNDEERKKRSILSGENEELDVQQDWMLLNSSEENGVTMLRFSRKLNTTDQEKDVVIQRGMSIFLIWAYHSTIDVNPESPQIFRSPLLQHTARGYQNITLIAATVTKHATPTPTAATVSVIPTVTRFVHLPNVVCFENINYNASWKITGNTNSLRFVAEVRAAGMIFGDTNQVPDNTVGYNVFLEGNLTGSVRVASVSMSNSACHKETLKSTTTVISTTSTTTTSPNTTQFTNSYDQGRFLLRWTFHDQNDTLTFHIRVKTTGWVGFGFADNAPNNMQDYDVIVGGFNNGQGYLNDYYTRGQTIPRLDDNQNYQLVDASEISEYTELIFHRPRDTNDNDDIQFEVEEEKRIIWAYGTGDIRNPSDFDRHTARGVGNIQLVIVDKQPVPTQAAVSSLHSCINAILIAVAIVFSNVLVM